MWIQCIKAKRLTVGPGSRHFRIVILWRAVFTFLYWKIVFTCQDSMLASGVGNPTRCKENGTGYTFSYFRGKALVRKPSKIFFCRRPGCRQFKMLEYVDTCWHFISNLLHLFFGQWFYVRGCRAERIASSADTLDKSHHEPGEEAQLPNPRQSVTADVHGSTAFSESIECASPILISTFNL